MFFQLETESSRAALVVQKLHDAALKADFLSVGFLHNMKDSQCVVGKTDPEAQLKIEAHRGLPKHNLAVRPNWLSGFVCQLHSGGTIAFGLAMYPEIIFHKREQIRITRPGCSLWQTTVRTMPVDFLTSVRPDFFIRDHKSVVKVLRHAEKLGILKNIHDTTGYWTSGKFEFACRTQPCFVSPVKNNCKGCILDGAA